MNTDIESMISFYIEEELNKENKKLPIDIPDPSFKGPF